MIASSFNRVVKKVLKEIIPTTKEIEFIGTIINELSSILTKKARILGINYTKIEPQGSTGIKQTQLRNDYDIDLFIGLDYSRFEQTYQELTKNKLKKEVKKDILHLCNRWIIDTLKDTKYSDPYLFYAEHPYVRVDYVENNIKIKIDIVL
jgi:tRNA nucleotidyltransferase (CCA-adding enzyme)